MRFLYSLHDKKISVRFLLGFDSSSIINTPFKHLLLVVRRGVGATVLRVRLLGVFAKSVQTRTDFEKRTEYWNMGDQPSSLCAPKPNRIRSEPNNQSACVLHIAYSSALLSLIVKGVLYYKMCINRLVKYFLTF